MFEPLVSKCCKQITHPHHPLPFLLLSSLIGQHKTQNATIPSMVDFLTPTINVVIYYICNIKALAARLVNFVRLWILAVKFRAIRTFL